MRHGEDRNVKLAGKVGDDLEALSLAGRGWRGCRRPPE
jgi:hypothetical protein